MPRSYTEEEIREIVSAVESADKAFRAGDFAIAEQIYQQAMPLLEQALGPEDPDTVACLQNLADCAFGMGRYESAVADYEKLVNIGERLLGKNHPDVRPLLIKLGQAYDLAGRAEQAQSIHNQIANPSYIQTNQGNDTADGASPAGDLLSQRQQLEQLQRSTQQYQALKLATNVPAPFLENEEDDEAAMTASQKLRRASAAKPPIASELRKVADAPALPVEPDDLLRFLRAKAPIYVPILGGLLVVVLIAFIFIVMPSSNPPAATVTKKPAQKTAPVVAAAVADTYYSTADEQEVLNIEEDGAAVTIGHNATRCPLVRVGKNWTDIFEILIGSITNKEIWYWETSAGLTRENGPLLYAKSAPEQLVAKIMRRTKQKAVAWYLASQRYPDSTDPFQSTDVMYQNPDSHALMQPILQRYDCAQKDLGQVIDGDQNLTLTEALRHVNAATKGTWRDEPKAEPFAVHCLSVISTGDNRSYQFFIHGFDRNGKLLRAAVPDTVYLIGLIDGAEIKSEVPSSFLDNRPVRPFRVVIAKPPAGFDEASMPYVWRLIHYVWAIIFFVLAAVCVVLAGFEQTTEEGNQFGAIAKSTAAKFVWVFVILFFAIMISLVAP